MNEIPQFIAEGPFALLFAFFMFGAFARSSATYALGRYANHLMLRPAPPTSGFPLRIWTWANLPTTQRAMATVRRRGWIAIPLACLTVGVQSFVMLAAGIIGLSYPRFALAAFPGWVAWAAIYSTIGFAVWNAAIAAAAGSPAGIAVMCAVIVGCGAYIVLKRRRKRRISK